MQFSFIIPVYNRPEELDELLSSVSLQGGDDFELIIVEDGSTRPSDEVAGRYEGKFPLKYVAIPNGGPGPARNEGARHASGEWLVFLDSDVVLPEGYLDSLRAVPALAAGQAGGCAAFGGPDAAGAGFTPVQRAISCSMTSFFTTGGIRGGKRKITRFFPRSFNMGVRRDVFDELGGFSDMRFGEDVDLSMRIYESGRSCELIREARVFHKRRTDFRKFFRQVWHSGEARLDLSRRHPGSLKLVHLFPSAFLAGSVLLLICAIVFVSLWPLVPVILYLLLVFADAFRRERSLKVAALAVPASVIQLSGYGAGFISAVWKGMTRSGKSGSGAFDNDKFYR